MNIIEFEFDLTFLFELTNFRSYVGKDCFYFRCHERRFLRKMKKIALFRISQAGLRSTDDNRTVLGMLSTTSTDP